MPADPEHTFEGLAEFRETMPKLAEASPHPVFVDLGSNYGGPAEGTNPDDPQQIPKQAIWNDRDDRLAYIGSDDYAITQHSEILRYIDEGVGQTVGEIDIGRIRDYGERIDGMVTLNGHNVDVAELTDDGYTPPEGELIDDRTASVEDAFAADGMARDILGVGVRFNNSFDASERIRIETMGYRYVCQNWMVWGEETIGEYTQLHINELQASDVEELIFDVIDQKEDQERIIVESIEDEAPWEWVGPQLEEVGFGPRQQKQIAQVLQGYAGTGGSELRRWDLYNAVTDYLDHDVALDVNANVYDRHQNKASKILTNDWSSPSETVPFDEVLGEADDVELPNPE